MWEGQVRVGIAGMGETGGDVSVGVGVCVFGFGGLPSLPYPRNSSLPMQSSSVRELSVGWCIGEVPVCVEFVNCLKWVELNNLM